MAKTATKSKAEPKAAPTKKPPQKKVRVRQQLQRGKNGGMLLVLVEDVAHAGKQGDLIEVKPGYGRNYLIPQGLAVVPTAHNLKLLEKYKIKVQKAREAMIADLKALAQQLSAMATINIEAVANEEGHLYGSIGPVEISKTLKGKNYKVEPEMIRMEHPIKEANILAEVPVYLGHEISTKIQVLVVSALPPAAPRK
jgi:large subunit ribosomal protein L9